MCGFVSTIVGMQHLMFHCSMPFSQTVKMKDPSRINNTSNIINNNEVILTNQFNNEDNPFAEYMWMENEEEFNRQVDSYDFSNTANYRLT